MHTALEAAKSSEAVVIATEWKEFREIPWEEVYETMNKPAFVFDGRLLVDADRLRQIGFKVRLVVLSTKEHRSIQYDPGDDHWQGGEALNGVTMMIWTDNTTNIADSFGNALSNPPVAWATLDF